MVDSASGPEVAPPVSDSNVDKVKRLFIVIQGDSMTSLQRAVLLCLLPCKVAACFVVHFVSDDVLPVLVIELIWTGTRAAIETRARSTH